MTRGQIQDGNRKLAKLKLTHSAPHNLSQDTGGKVCKVHSSSLAQLGRAWPDYIVVPQCVNSLSLHIIHTLQETSESEG